jgi:hypothetical protein
MCATYERFVGKKSGKHSYRSYNVNDQCKTAATNNEYVHNLADNYIILQEKMRKIKDVNMPACQRLKQKGISWRCG